MLCTFYQICHMYKSRGLRVCLLMSSGMSDYALSIPFANVPGLPVALDDMLPRVLASRLHL